MSGVERSGVGLALSPAVCRVLESWWPARLDPDDAAAYLVLPVVRAWVAAAAPATAKAERPLLWATPRLAVRAHLTLGSVDPTIVLDPHNVQHFTMHVNATMSPGWQHQMRSALLRVGRAVSPQGWAPSPPQAGLAAAACTLHVARGGDFVGGAEGHLGAAVDGPLDALMSAASAPLTPEEAVEQGLEP